MNILIGIGLFMMLAGQPLIGITMVVVGLIWME